MSLLFSDKYQWQVYLNTLQKEFRDRSESNFVKHALDYGLKNI